MNNNEDILNLDINAPNITEEELKAKSADILELRYITRENGKFKRTSGGFVSLEYMGKIYERVFVYRTFPLTHPDEYISIREADEKAREIGMIKNLGEISKIEKEMIEEQLKIRYFTPIIEKIIDVKDEYGYAYFHVVTNFGTCRFTINMGGDAVVSLTENRIMINDLDGNRFEIPDIRTLSATERKKIDLFV